MRIEKAKLLQTWNGAITLPSYRFAWTSSLSHLTDYKMRQSYKYFELYGLSKRTLKNREYVVQLSIVSTYLLTFNNKKIFCFFSTLDWIKLKKLRQKNEKSKKSIRALRKSLGKIYQQTSSKHWLYLDGER